MTLLKCQEIKKSFGELTVLSGVTTEINAGDRIGLVGDNGAGKTTLANILCGELEPDSGQILRYKQKLRIGYLRQSSSYTLNLFNELVTEANQPDLADEFLSLTSHLGLCQVSRWDESRFAGLSGGERTKLALANIWVTEPDVLILDEPTNHMDFHGVEWLVEELRQFAGTALIISHNRYFLDQAVKRIVELDAGKVIEYPGNYTWYRDEKSRRFQSQLQQYQDDQKQQRKIQQDINRLANWSAKAHRDSTKQEGMKEYYRVKAKKRDQQIKSRVKMLKKMHTEGVEKPKAEQDIQFQLENADKRGRRIIAAEKLAMHYPGKPLFSDSSFYIQRGEKVALFGPNGCGKTTFIRLLLGEEEPVAGRIWRSPSLRPGYLSQDVGDLDGGKNALEILGLRDKIAVTRARTLLANMGFTAAMVKRKIRHLSLGERTRIKLADMVLKDMDLLILDEPTNHLDLHSREQLEDTLADYNGTLLLITHDRYLLERICDKLLVFENQRIRRVEQRFKDYWERDKKQAQADQAQQKTLIETRMAWLASRLSELTPEDEKYCQLDEEFKALAKQKRELS